MNHRFAMLELELTGRCPLACDHCLTRSSPLAGHGTMTTPDWRAVIDQMPGAGFDKIQFIGGELPTVHPDFSRLVRHALRRGLKTEIFTNLYRVPARMWELFTLPGISLATSYYSATAAGHQRVTGRKGSHERTRTNIKEAMRRGIPLRVGVVDVLGGTHAEQAP